MASAAIVALLSMAVVAAAWLVAFVRRFRHMSRVLEPVPSPPAPTKVIPPPLRQLCHGGRNDAQHEAATLAPDLPSGANMPSSICRLLLDQLRRSIITAAVALHLAQVSPRKSVHPSCKATASMWPHFVHVQGRPGPGSTGALGPVVPLFLGHPLGRDARLAAGRNAGDPPFASASATWCSSATPPAMKRIFQVLHARGGCLRA